MACLGGKLDDGVNVKPAGWVTVFLPFSSIHCFCPCDKPELNGHAECVFNGTKKC